MLFTTHILIGILFFFLLIDFFSSGNEILFLFFVLFGSILPDIDEGSSKIVKWLGLPGKIISFFSRHRGFFHSLLFLILATLVIKYLLSEFYAWGLFIGITSHLLADALTKQGVPILYPFSFRLRGFLRTNGLGEILIQVGILVFVVVRVVF